MVAEGPPLLGRDFAGCRVGGAGGVRENAPNPGKSGYPTEHKKDLGVVTPGGVVLGGEACGMVPWYDRDPDEFWGRVALLAGLLVALLLLDAVLRWVGC